MEKIKNKLEAEMLIIKNTSLQRWILFFIIVGLSVIVPTLGLNTYFKYLDTTNYYQVQNPVQVKQDDINPCDTITLNFQINSLIETVGTSHRALMKTDIVDGKGTRISSETKEIPITKTQGFELKPIEFYVPCSLTEGSYYFYSVVSYDVRDITKYTTWESTVFKVSIDD